MAEKLYRINTNIDLDKVHKPLLIDKSKQLEGGGFGEMKAPEFFSNIVMQAINQAHPTGNLASLRRTRSLSENMHEGVRVRENRINIRDTLFELCACHCNRRFNSFPSFR